MAVFAIWSVPGFRKTGMSVVLTVFSLGTRVALAYILSAIPEIGVVGIWWSVPIGWALADIVGLLYYKIQKTKPVLFYGLSRL